MKYNITKLVLYLCNFYVSFGVALPTDRCSKTLSNGELEWFCCDNHEDKNGTCKECGIGFTSDRGEPCYPCSHGLFGYKCSVLCSCTANQRCDHIYGCIYPRDTTLSNFHIGTAIPTRGTEIALDTYSEEPRDVSLGVLTREIVIYSICVGGLVFVSLLCLIIRRRNGQHIEQSNNTISSNIEHTVSQDEEECPDSSGRAEGIYETIDETNMLDLRDPYLDPYDESSGMSEREENEEPHAGDNNVNAYQTIASDIEVHSYIDLPIKAPTDSSSGESNIEEVSSEYLNPYQPVVPDPDVHEYITTAI